MTPGGNPSAHMPVDSYARRSKGSFRIAPLHFRMSDNPRLDQAASAVFRHIAIRALAANLGQKAWRKAWDWSIDLMAARRRALIPRPTRAHN